jgi:enoyl-CoA hydratase/carnithine racemase
MDEHRGDEAMTAPTYIRREDPAEGVARIVLARPEKRNAQSPELLYQLDDALLAAANDAAVRVIVLAADGPDFSSGHDLAHGFTVPRGPVATMGGHLGHGMAEGHYAFECETYLGLSRRWRDLPKPTIAQAQGRSIAGGLMLLWPMDLIVASEEATFADPVTAFGVNGVEYFTHVWEVGHRKAREMLFTGEALSAQEAHRLGMVNHVVPLDELESFTLALATRIAARPPFGLRLAKESVNRTLDAQGQSVLLESAIGLHNLGHAASLARTGHLADPAGAEVIRSESKRR